MFYHEPTISYFKEVNLIKVTEEEVFQDCHNNKNVCASYL